MFSTCAPRSPHPGYTLILAFPPYLAGKFGAAPEQRGPGKVHCFGDDLLYCAVTQNSGASGEKVTKLTGRAAKPLCAHPSTRLPGCAGRAHLPRAARLCPQVMPVACLWQNWLCSGTETLRDSQRTPSLQTLLQCSSVSDARACCELPPAGTRVTSPSASTKPNSCSQTLGNFGAKGAMTAAP